MVVSASAEFSFIVTNDTRFFGNEHMKENLRDAMGCIARRHGDADFMISPGDITPVKETHRIIKDSMGRDFRWYPLVGNHESDTDSDQVYLKEHIASLPGIVHFGPVHAESTMYSFDVEEIHFVCINVYYDGINEFSSWKTNGVSDACYEWIRNDLQETDKEEILVFGHVPAFVLRDEDTGMEYQMDSDLSLSGGNPENRDRFWALLKQHKVIAYFCGHQHSYYSELFDGVYQFNAGAISDNSASYDSYIRVIVTDTAVSIEGWREYTKDHFTLKETISQSLTETGQDGTTVTVVRRSKSYPYGKVSENSCYLLDGKKVRVSDTYLMSGNRQTGWMVNPPDIMYRRNTGQLYVGKVHE